MKTWNGVAIVGVGLIGGSIGLALKAGGLARQVIGIGRSPERLTLAKRKGAIDRFTTDLAEGVAEADCVVVCTPVDQAARHILQALRYVPSGALVTDAASTKQQIVAAVEEALRKTDSRSSRAPTRKEKNSAKPAPSPPLFIGSHPLAGSEKSGVDAARADLFKGRAVVVTPTNETSSKAATLASEFWKSLGARVVTMSPDEHDRAVAATSHLPHLLASALAAATPAELLPLTAGGWLDTTRIAAGDGELWTQILASNRSHVLKTLARFGKVLEEFRAAIVDRDEARLRSLLEAGKKLRDAVGS